MKTCPKCKKQVKDDAKFCKFCGFNLKKNETSANKPRFCPECGAEVDEGAFCPECGYNLNETDAPEPLFNFSDDTAQYDDGKFAGFDAMLKKQEAASEDAEAIKRINVLCMRGNFEAAEKAAQDYADKYFDKTEGYIALLRVHSKDYSEYEGKQIENDIKIIRKIGGDNVKDADYCDYINARERYFADKKSKDKAAKKKTIEDEFSEAESLYNAEKYEQAFPIFQKLAESGHARSQSMLGEYYINGEYVASDWELGAYWLQKAADQGDSLGQRQLGECYKYGYGVPKDMSKARYWYQKAAAQGDSLSEAYLKMFF